MMVIHVFSDIRRMNAQAVTAQKTGMIIIGGGLMKHHICNANLMVGVLVHVNVFHSGEPTKLSFERQILQ